MNLSFTTVSRSFLTILHNWDPYWDPFNAFGAWWGSLSTLAQSCAVYIFGKCLPLVCAGTMESTPNPTAFDGEGGMASN
jgi:hypothetical protein